MKRKPIFIIAISCLSILILSLSVYAGYVFTKSFGNQEVETGKISYNVATDYQMYYFSPENTTEKNASSDTVLLPENSISVDGVYGYNMASRVMTCYATKKLGFSDEEDYLYLNQIGFVFRYKANIDTSYRISVKSSWISHKVYLNGTTTENIITKDKMVSGLFTIDEDNYFIDNETEYIYAKSTVKGTDKYQTIDFKCSNDYFYNITSNASYREYIIVQIAFEVDIVQANRALSKWGLTKFPWN